MILCSPPFFGGANPVIDTTNADTPRPAELISVPHRGIHLKGAAPENSLDSALLAHRCGFKYVECDLRRTKDGVWVLLHDLTLNRTFKNSDYTDIVGDIYVSDLTYQEIVDGYVYASPNPRMRKPITKFDDYMYACRDLGLKVVPELQASGDIPYLEPLIKRANNILGFENVFWQSFNRSILRAVRALDSRLVLYMLTSSPSLDHVVEVKDLKPCVYFPALYVSSQIVDAMTEVGVRSAAWTVPPSSFDQMLKKGINDICSDHAAPPIDRSRIIGSVGGVDDLVSDGQVVDGQLILTEGQTATFTGDVVGLGAYYIYINAVSGSGTITGRNLSGALVAGGYRTQSLIVNDRPNITITASAQGLVIDFIRIEQCQF